MDPLTWAAIIIGSSIFGHKGLSLLGEHYSGKRQLDLGLRELESREKISAAELAGKRQSATESSREADKYLQTLMKMRTRESLSGERQQYTNLLMQGQQNELGMMMAALQALSDSNRTPPPTMPGSMGMLSLLR